MLQSTLPETQERLHVAIILDGNGRWATARGLARSAGHRAGMEAVRRVLTAARPLGIGTLTLFAFSAGNWQRPREEVRGLMQIFRDFFLEEVGGWVKSGIRVRLLGRRDRLPAALLTAAEAAEARTAAREALLLRLAIDYSAREAILGAARRLAPARELTEECFARALADELHVDAPVRDIGLLIRTGGELRLSDCLLWEGAYAELVFSERLWPDFDAHDLEAAVREFHSRERRFGRVARAATS